MDIYLHLDCETFAAALANDQRSFSVELFKDVSQRIEKNLSRASSDVTKFQALSEKAHEIVLANLKKDEDYEDAPDEFIGKFNDKKKSQCWSRMFWRNFFCFRSNDVWIDGGSSFVANFR